MNFQDLKKVELPEFYIEKAFKHTGKDIRLLKFRGKTTLDRFKYKELKRLEILENNLSKDLTRITMSFPTIDKLPVFYKELVNVNIGVKELKKSLASLVWIKKKIRDLRELYRSKIKSCRDVRKINDYRKSFYGRVSSLFKQSNKDFLFIENARRVMEKFPTIKTKTPVVCLCGFPNVGKSTLLRGLSGSKVEIKPYPFTTKRLLLGKIKQGSKKLQLLDTPGLFDRGFEERNKIELQSIMALKYITNVIMFILDPSESCGYSVEEQLNLLKSIDFQFKKPIIIILNKIDLCNEQKILDLCSVLQNYEILKISAKNEDDLLLLRKRLFKIKKIK